MTSILTTNSISKSYGPKALFENLSFSISPDDHIGMIGPNGAGKTSLLKIIAGAEPPDKGDITTKKSLRIGLASQSPNFPSVQIDDYLVDQIPEIDKTDASTKAAILLGQAEFTNFSQDAATLSGGWKKRLDIVRALIGDPDLLLLDEPTNHLDLEGILWLEAFLKKLHIPTVVISHDRYFLDNVSNKIIEINPCYPNGMLEVPGNMASFERERTVYLNQLENEARKLKHKVREEVEWLRTSPKARTTKSQSRVQQAHQMIEDLSIVKQRQKQDKVKVEFSSSKRQTRKLIVANNVEKKLGGKTLFSKVDLTLTPGIRLGIVGKNGTGKTTFLKILANLIPQDVGTIKVADNLRLVHFDQHREQIPLDVSLKEALSPNGDMVDYRGQKIHVNGFARRFLFTPDRLTLPVRLLSGGERARILIAKLMLEPADVLFLDEPTNDLDISTLEVIEENLTTFPGAVVLISHDRCLMDNICNKILVLEEDGTHEFYADYKQWANHTKNEAKIVKSKKKPPTTKEKKKSTRLSYHEKKELEGMEETILKQEEVVADFESYLSKGHNAPEDYQNLADAQQTLETLYKRWQDLMDRSN